MRPFPDGPSAVPFLARAVAPYECQGQHGNELFYLRQVAHVRFLHPEAPFLETGEEHLYLPPFTVRADGTFPRQGGGHDKVVPVGKAPSGKVDLRSGDARPPELFFPSAIEEPGGRCGLPLGGGDDRIALDPDMEPDPFPYQEGEPLPSDELPVGQQVGDAPFPEKGDEGTQQCYPFSGIGSPFFGEHLPGGGDTDAPVIGRQHEYIDVPVAEPPVGTVDGDHKGAIGQEVDQYSGNQMVVHQEIPEEPLKVPVDRCRFDPMGHAPCRFAQVHRAPFHQGHDQAGHELGT